MTRVAVLGGHGKTGRSVCAALTARGAEAEPLGRADAEDLLRRSGPAGTLPLRALIG